MPAHPATAPNTPTNSATPKCRYLTHRVCTPTLCHFDRAQAQTLCVFVFADTSTEGCDALLFALLFALHNAPLLVIIALLPALLLALLLALVTLLTALLVTVLVALLYTPLLVLVVLMLALSLVLPLAMLPAMLLVLLRSCCAARAAARAAHPLARVNQGCPPRPVCAVCLCVCTTPLFCRLYAPNLKKAPQKLKVLLTCAATANHQRPKQRTLRASLRDSGLRAARRPCVYIDVGL